MKLAIPFGIASLHASSVLVGGAIAFSLNCALAQITPDGTLPNNSIVTPSGNTNIIEGGTQAGSNLFHSFEQFSVPTGGEAFFNNALDIRNIISRVTGESISNINGLLRANGSANLFLLNPNGIIFGPNASLAIGGSFVGSTANSLNFADDTQFSATNPQAIPLLTVSVPIGLQYGGAAGSIQVQQSILQVQPGQTLALTGGDVSVEGGEFGFLSALGGRIELGGLTGAGTVDIEGQQSEGVFRLTALRFPDAVERADVLLTNYAYVDVTGGGGGSIAINARNLEVSGGVLGESGIRARIASGMGSPEATAGDITLNATGAITVAQSSYIENYVDSDATGNAGNIDIKAGNLFIRDGGQIYSGTFGSGNGGNITVIINDLAEVTGSKLGSGVELGARGMSGDVSIKTRRLIVRNSQIGTAVFGEGNAGDFKIIASDSVEVSGKFGQGGANSFPGGLFAQVDSTGKGRGGNLTIETKHLSVSDSSKVQVATFGDGDAGNLFIRADEIDVFETEKPNFYSTGLFAGVQTDGRVEAGIIDDLRNNRPPKGKGGELTIETRNLSLRNGGQVFVQTTGDGNAGRLFIRASESVNVTGISTSKLERQRHSIITSAASQRSTGNSGSITIETPQLNVADSGIISSSSEGVGKAGDVNIKAGFVRLNNGQIIAETASTDGGNINLKFSQELLLRNNSIISTNAGTAQAGGNGGNITINAPNGFIVAVPNENTDITANSTNSFGGRVTINSLGIFGTQFRPSPTPESDITATGESPALNGTVEINTPDVDPSQGLVQLPVELANVSGLIAQGCSALGKNEFIVTGRGGLPPTPSDPLSGEAVITDWSTLDSDVENRFSAAPATNSTKVSTPTQIVEAQGWVINNKGKVVLTANAPNATLHNPWMPSANCHEPQNPS